MSKLALLDTMSDTDLMNLWQLSQQGQSLARQLFPEKRAGYTMLTRTIGHYAANRATALRCQASGDQSSAEVYFGIAENIYNRLPGEAQALIRTAVSDRATFDLTIINTQTEAMVDFRRDLTRSELATILPAYASIVSQAGFKNLRVEIDNALVVVEEGLV